MIKSKILDILGDVGREVDRAVSKHGPLKSLHEAHSVILEEMDEFWEQVKKNPYKMGPSEQEFRRDNIKEELIQIAAMCIRTLMDVEL